MFSGITTSYKFVGVISPKNGAVTAELHRLRPIIAMAKMRVQDASFPFFSVVPRLCTETLAVSQISDYPGFIGGKEAFLCYIAHL
jgi:hypothetical protein